MALAFSTWEDRPRLSGSTALDRPAMPEEGPGVRVSPFSSHSRTQQDVKQLEPENKLLSGTWLPAVQKTTSLWSFHNVLVFHQEQRGRGTRTTCQGLASGRGEIYLLWFLT